MNSVYTTVRDRTTKSLCHFWDCPPDVALIEVDTEANYPAPQVGDFVVVHTNGKLRRASSNPSSRPYGLTIGFPPNAEVYPAFGGHYDKKALVGMLFVGTELVLPLINAGASAADGVGAGEYLPANKTNIALKEGDTAGLYYNSTTGRWGIGVAYNATSQAWENPSGVNPRVRIVRFVKRDSLNTPVASGEGDYAYALVVVE